MGVTIDSIQIEVQSSSTNAAKGIDSLAKSLEGLKKNGSFKTVSNNLNNLSAALKDLPNVHQASNALRTLANSIEKLKGVGSVSGLANSLKKLPQALKDMGDIETDGLKTKLTDIANAISPLSSIKAGGLGTMVNAMKNLEKLNFADITQNLKGEAVKEFIEKVRELNEELGPLSEKMTSIKAGFSAINSRARSASSGIEDFSESVDASALNLSSFIEIARTVVDAIRSIVEGFVKITEQAIEWDGIAERFGRSFGSQAQETYAWIQRLNDEMGLNVQQFMQYSSLYAQMLTGFGVANEDAGKMALGYTELTYDIWASANDRYKTFEDAAEAVASAIAGEVEPIRRAGFTIVEATLAETAAYHGLDISLANATESQKSYLRYLTLIDQAHSTGTIGVYAAELDTAEGLMRTFSQQLKSLTQALGSLFLPILAKVMPYLQAFVELLTEAVYWLAGLFGVEIQKVDFSGYEAGAGAIENITNSAGGATDALNSATKAAKDLKNATLGIDELNVISPSSATGGSSGSGGAGGGSGAGADFGDMDIDSLWDESIFDSIQSNVDEIKTKLKGVFDDWLPTIQIIGAALGGWTIAKLLEQFGDALKISSKFEGTVTNIRKLTSSAIIVAIQFKLMEDAFGDYMSDGGTILDYIEGVLIGAAGTYLLFKTWGTGGLAIGLGVTAAVSLKTVIEAGGVTDMESAIVAITGIATAIGALASAMKTLSGAWAAIKASKFIGDLGAFIALAKEGGFIATFAATFPKLSSALGGIGKAVGGVGTKIKGLLGIIGIKGAIIVAAIAAIGLAVYTVIENWDAISQWFVDLGNTISDFFTKTVPKLWNDFVGWLSNIPDKLRDFGYSIGHALGTATKACVDWFNNDLIPFFTTTIPNFLTQDVPNFITKTVPEWFSGVGKAIKDFFTVKVPEWFLSLIDSIGKFFTEDIPKFFTEIIPNFLKECEKVGKALIDGILNGITGGAKWLLDSITGFCGGVVDGFKDAFGIASPSKVMKDEIGKNISDGIAEGMGINAIKNKLSSMWSTAKGWWDKSKETLTSYTPSIGNISTKLSSAWTSAKDWWKDKRSSLSYTPSIGKIWENLRGAWTSAKDWWNKSRSNLSYTPSIGSISSKLSSAWTSAKNWWSKNRSSLSYTPSIGSIKDKVVSAWNTAKKWWSSNASLSTKLNVSVPKITVKWDTASAFGKSFKYPTGFSLKFAADGGIFDKGSLIWAGERGPEVMANAGGGRTGVMNVQQMQEAVYEGVYAAVIAAMRGNGGNGGTQSVNVYLDGKQITAAVEQRQHERGASIMGNEVYSY